MSQPDREKGGYRAGHDDPSPEEIRAHCREFQAAWSRREEQQRAGRDPDARWQPPRMTQLPSR